MRTIIDFFNENIRNEFKKRHNWKKLKSPARITAKNSHREIFKNLIQTLKELKTKDLSPLE